MAISVTEPVSQAFDRAGRMLFKPFDAAKWFTMGFCAWLAFLGEGGSNFQLPDFGGGGGGPVPGPAPGPRFPTPGPSPFPGPGGGGGVNTGPEAVPEVWDDVKQFFFEHAIWLVPVIIAVLALVVALMWIRARGKFMFMECVAYDRAAVVEPWKRLKAPANSFFRFELLLTILFFVALAALVGVAVMIALPDIRAERFGPGAMTAVFGGSLLLLILGLGFGLLRGIAEDFLMPLMYLRGYSIGPAWGEFRRSILSGHVGSIVLFYLMRIVLGIATAVATVVLTCVTCCIVAIPYLGTVILLPLFVFHRSYSLYFLRQFGQEFNLLVEIPTQPVGAFQVVMQPGGGGYQEPYQQGPYQQPYQGNQPYQAPPPPPPPGDAGGWPGQGQGM